MKNIIIKDCLETLILPELTIQKISKDVSTQPNLTDSL